MIRIFFYCFFLIFISCQESIIESNKSSSRNSFNHSNENITGNSKNNISNKDLSSHEYNVLNKDVSSDMNKMMQMDESFKISKYCSRQGWNMVETDCGVFYSIVKDGIGVENPSLGDTVELKYEVRLLDTAQSLCYSSNDYNPKGVSLVLGKSPVISGLHTSISYLKKGDSAIVVLPQFLAYGVAGDNNMIPMYQPLLFYLKVLDVKI